MKNILTVLVPVLTLIACNDNTADTKAGDSEVPGIVQDSAVMQTSCYAYINAKDTVSLILHLVDNKVTGDLLTNFFEKDKNTGTISGMMHGDTVIVDYVFRSEGMLSARQEVFLKKGNDLIQGYGDLEEKANKMVYKNIAAVDFSKGIVLKNTMCK